MSSFFGYRSSSSSSRPRQETHQSEMERLRGRQLASLVRAGGRAKNLQQTTFEVPIAETSRGALTLVLTLPSDFPIKAPHVKTSMPMQHPWLDAAGTVKGHADLNQWTAHSDLGRIVSEIVNELRRAAASALASRSPVANASPSRAQAAPSKAAAQAGVKLSQPSIYPYPNNTQQQIQQLQQQQQQQQEVDRLPRAQMPAIPSIYPELEELSLSQLENLAVDRHAFKAFVKKTNVVQEFMKLREDVMTGNIQIAEKTLSYEERMRALQAEVQQLRASLRLSQQSLAEKQSRQQRVTARRRPDALIEQLKAATQVVDLASDDLAHEFTHGGVDVARFISDYLPQRQLYHERNIRLTKVIPQ